MVVVVEEEELLDLCLPHIASRVHNYISVTRLASQYSVTQSPSPLESHLHHRIVL